MDPQCCEKDPLGRALPLTFLCHSWVKGPLSVL